MTNHPQPSAKDRPRTRLSIAAIAALLVFCATAMVLWAFTALGLVFALAAAAPVTFVVTCCIVAVDPVADCFASLMEGIGEGIGTVAAAILAALAAVFSIFG